MNEVDSLLRAPIGCQGPKLKIAKDAAFCYSMPNNLALMIDENTRIILLDKDERGNSLFQESDPFFETFESEITYVDLNPCINSAHNFKYLMEEPYAQNSTRGSLFI